jgi:hypothetical protein
VYFGDDRDNSHANESMKQRLSTQRAYTHMTEFIFEKSAGFFWDELENAARRQNSVAYLYS